jgi:putative phosphoesterase
MADAHDRVPAIRAFMERFAAAGVGFILHAGDYCSPFSLAPIVEAQMALAGVFGRNDGDHAGLEAEARRGLGIELYGSPHTLDVEGKRIMLVHELSDVADRTLEAHALVVHGCSHRAEIERRGETLLINPGEACGWLYGVPRAAIVDLETNQVESLALEGPEWRT